MLKWLTKALHWRKAKTPTKSGLVVTNYGRYQLKPVLERALMEVVKIDRLGLIHLVSQKQLFFNGSLLVEVDLTNRLGSGNYQLVNVAHQRAWVFFIA